MKSLKIRSWLLGSFMFTFGTLKLLNPFGHWFHVQLINSGIGDLMFPFGVGTEITTGLILLGALLFKSKMSDPRFLTLMMVGSGLVVFTMITAIYVHLQPNVPANVLPLAIKPPFIPVSVLIFAVTNIVYTLKLYRKAIPADR